MFRKKESTDFKPDFYSIIIVTWNAQTHIKSCLDSIRQQSYRQFEVILVDNGSTDDTLKTAETAMGSDAPERFNIIRNSENLGFCKANNIGIDRAQGEFVLLLNADVTLHKFFLENAIEVIRRKPNYYGLFNPKIMKTDKLTIDSLGLVRSSARRFYNLHEGEADQSSFELSLEIFGVCGAAAILKHEMLQQTVENGGQYLDERFFFLAEDFELSWRAARKGWKSLYIPQAICYHVGHSAKFADKHRQYLSFRNRYYLIIKHEGLKGVLRCLVNPYDIVRLGCLLCTNTAQTVKALAEVVKFFKDEILQKKKAGSHAK